MPTKPVLPITELDFFRVKNQLKEFLRNDPQGRFQDIDFEGSNISVLLDVLAYNTYQNNFYTNMAISEMFLDSAQLENSVVSHAKELNYLPRSAVSAKAIVNVSIRNQTNTESTIVIPVGARFTSRQTNQIFNFHTAETYVARRVGENYIAENIEIFEGELVEESFVATVSRKSYRLLNQNIDVSSIKVFETDQASGLQTEYTFRNDIFGISSDDAVFYLQPGFDSTYEIVFGNNRFGRTPANGSRIRVAYRLSNGSGANGAYNFTSSFNSGPNSLTALNTTVTTVERAFGGAERESIEDIKFFAPRSIQVQERAVTERDYEVLLKQRFNEIQDISVFGGDELSPPRFGKVAIAVNLTGGLSEVAARKYEEYIRAKTPVGIQPVFVPPEFLYIDLKLDVIYDQSATSQSKGAIEAEIRETLQRYSRTNLNKFGASFEVSRVSTLIDDSNPAIVNNTLEAIPYILYSPEFDRKENPTFTFGTNLDTPCRFARANRTESYNSFVRSSPFIFEGTEAIFEDNGLGIINIVNTRDRGLGVIEVLRRNVGTVEYETGVVKLSDFKVDFYEGQGIKIRATTSDINVVAPKNRVLLINDADVVVTVKETRSR
jgi:hypothetical protein